MRPHEARVTGIPLVRGRTELDSKTIPHCDIPHTSSRDFPGAHRLIDGIHYSPSASRPLSPAPCGRRCMSFAGGRREVGTWFVWHDRISIDPRSTENGMCRTPPRSDLREHLRSNGSQSSFLEAFVRPVAAYGSWHSELRRARRSARSHSPSCDRSPPCARRRSRDNRRRPHRSCHRARLRSHGTRRKPTSTH